ncbi:MAG: NADH-quinone oxidoreductase subunit NuoE [Anaerolineales bacterium]
MTSRDGASFLEIFREEVDAILAKYPAEHKRAAVMPLLFLAQREEGFISPRAVQAIARLLEIDPTQVGGLIGFYTLYTSRRLGRHRMQICTDLPCALQGAEEFSRQVCQRLEVRPGETTADQAITVEEVMCLAACHRAPVFQVQDRDGLHYHETQTVETAMEWAKGARGGAE